MRKKNIYINNKLIKISSFCTFKLFCRWKEITAINNFKRIKRKTKLKNSRIIDKID